jgi:hypothetical protein
VEYGFELRQFFLHFPQQGVGLLRARSNRIFFYFADIHVIGLAHSELIAVRLIPLPQQFRARLHRDTAGHFHILFRLETR